MEFLGGIFAIITVLLPFVALVGLIKPSFLKQKNRKQVLLRFLLPVPIFFVLAGMLLPTVDNADSNQIEKNNIVNTDTQKESPEQEAKEAAESKAKKEEKETTDEKNSPWREKIAARPKYDVLEVMKTELKPWQPQSTKLNNNVLSIVLPQDRITDDIFRAVILYGICGSLFSSGKRWEGVKEVQVLNRYNKQGYIFEGGENECIDKIADMPNDEAVKYIFSKSRTHPF